MGTPCIVAVGTRTAWRGVPGKLDGIPGWSGCAIIDRVVTCGGVAAAATALVDAAPHGWECVGGNALTERDDYLGAGELRETTPGAVLDRFYALYILDPGASRLDVRILPDDTWLAPVEFTETGAPRELPDWYPQPAHRTVTRRRPRPPDVTKELQALCLQLDLPWGVVTEALRRWLLEQLGDLAGCPWLVQMDSGDGELARCLVGDDCHVHVSTSALLESFAGADGRLRAIDIHDVDGLQHCFAALGLRPTHAMRVAEEWLSRAYAHGSQQKGARASWMSGSKRWSFDVITSGFAQHDYAPRGTLATLLAWLF